MKGSVDSIYKAIRAVKSDARVGYIHESESTSEDSWDSSEHSQSVRAEKLL